MALVLGDVVISVGESFVRMIVLVLRLFDLVYCIAEVGRRELGVQPRSMTEPYSCGVRWPRSLSATFHTNATLSLKPSGAAMTYPLDARVRTGHATEAVRQSGPQALQGPCKRRGWAA